MLLGGTCSAALSRRAATVLEGLAHGAPEAWASDLCARLSFCLVCGQFQGCGADGLVEGGGRGPTKMAQEIQWLPCGHHFLPPALKTDQTQPLNATEAAPGSIGDMADTPRDVGLKQAPAPRTEKAPVDFGYVGIDSILEQMRRKAMKQGFEFNIMVVAPSRLEWATLPRSCPHSRVPAATLSSVSFCSSLRPLDIEFMKRLSKVVNIVPVIAKADTLTLEERVYFKQRITADLLSNGIDVYPQKEFDEDSEDRMVNEKFREMIPFAVVGSDHEYQVNGKRILGRKTKWGTIEVENTTHCEFAYLRDLLIRTHMQNIKDIPSSIHFEAYRVKRLHEGSGAVANGVQDKAPEAQEG
ncbi:hypothetical protein CB1_000299019 [Camelus ferus]|nr:hypothetical protein CB1_000299019 [Camelus ferus]